MLPVAQVRVFVLPSADVTVNVVGDDSSYDDKVRVLEKVAPAETGLKSMVWAPFVALRAYGDAAPDIEPDTVSVFAPPAAFARRQETLALS